MVSRHRFPAALIILALNVASVGSGAAGEQTAPPATRYDDHVQAGGVPPPSGRLHNPHEGDADSAKSGESLYASMNCDGCHGGAGSGWVGPSLADGRWRYGGRDEEIFNSIFYGRPKGMPAFGGAIGSEGIWMLVTYLKSLPVPDGMPTQSWIEPKGTTAQPDRNQETSGSAAPSSAVSTPKPAADTGKPDLTTLLRSNGCTACHAVDTKVIGPSFQEVAAKYRRQSGAEQKLFESAKNGSSGVWGNIPMPPNSAASENDLHGIIKQILALK